MTREVKQIISAIANTKFSNEKVLGDLIAPILFKKGETAFCVLEDKSCYLLTRDNESEAIVKMKLNTLFELLSTLESLIKDKAIFLLPQELSLSLYYEGKSYLEIGQDPTSAKINDRVVFDYSNEPFINCGGKIILTATPIADVLGNEILRYLSSIVLPTASLKEYVKRSCRTEGQHALHLSKVNMWVAVVVACLSPWLALFLNNKLGRTTINEEQINQVILKEEEISSNVQILTDTLTQSTNQMLEVVMFETPVKVEIVNIEEVKSDVK